MQKYPPHSRFTLETVFNFLADYLNRSSFKYSSTQRIFKPNLSLFGSSEITSHLKCELMNLCVTLHRAWPEPVRGDHVAERVGDSRLSERRDGAAGRASVGGGSTQPIFRGREPGTIAGRLGLEADRQRALPPRRSRPARGRRKNLRHSNHKVKWNTLNCPVLLCMQVFRIAIFYSEISLFDD